MPRSLSTAKEVVDMLGGVRAVSEMAQAEIKAVYHWTGRSGMFPARLHWKMQRALRRKGCTAPAWMWNQTGAEKRV